MCVLIPHACPVMHRLFAASLHDNPNTKRFTHDVWPLLARAGLLRTPLGGHGVAAPAIQPGIALGAALAAPSSPRTMCARTARGGRGSGRSSGTFALLYARMPPRRRASGTGPGAGTHAPRCPPRSRKTTRNLGHKYHRFKKALLWAQT